MRSSLDEAKSVDDASHVKAAARLRRCVLIGLLLLHDKSSTFPSKQRDQKLLRMNFRSRATGQ